MLVEDFSEERECGSERVFEVGDHHRYIGLYDFSKNAQDECLRDKWTHRQDQGHRVFDRK